MASEYTEHFNLDLYTDNDRPNLRDQYNAAIRKIDNKMFDQVTTINLLDSVVDNLKEDVEQMQTDLTNEVTARTNADTALGTRIDNEATARESADQTLTTDLAAEVTAREGADTTLDNKITAETTARTNADTALGDRIDGEVTARTNADTVIDDKITQEISDRAAADQAINTRIDNLSMQKRIIVIGDSYLMEPTPLINSDVVNQCNAEYIKTVEDYGGSPGGGGFLTGGTALYSAQIELLVNNMTAIERAAITDVVFAGGWNDGNHYYDNESSNYGTTRATIAAARTAFPNARVLVYFMYCGCRLWKDYSNGRRRNFAKAVRMYRDCADLEGAGFGWCNSAPYITNDGATRDNVHPNVRGLGYLRPVFVNLVNNGHAKDFIIGEENGYYDHGDIFHTRTAYVFNWNYTVDTDKQVFSEVFNSAGLGETSNGHMFGAIVGDTTTGIKTGWIDWKMIDNKVHAQVMSAQNGLTFRNGTAYFLSESPSFKRYDPNYDVSN